MKFLKPSYEGINAKTLTTFIASIYLIVILAIYPFYMKEGYVDVGYHKYTFFLYSSIGAVLLLLLTGIFPLLQSFSKFRLVDLFIMLFVVITTISYLFSDYRKQAFLGADGWYMGFLTLLMIAVLFILISRLWEYQPFVISLCLIAVSLVYLLAILDRFSIYVIPLELRHSSFISTIGNINWLMGYYSVFTPIGILLFLYEVGKEEVSSKIYPLFVFTFISLIAGFAQGGESVFVFDLALFTGLFYLSYKKNIKIEFVFSLVGLWGLSSQIIRLLRWLLPTGYNYSKSGLCSRLTDGNHLLIISFLAFLIAYSIYKCRDNDKFEKLEKCIYFGLVVLLAGTILFWIIIGILKTNTEIINGFNNSVFLFNEHFGSDRGMAIKSAFEGIKKMSLKQVLIGVGPDCFKEFVYSIPNIKFELRAFWPNDVLTNAHMELLNMLVNEGILGFITYIGIFVSFIAINFRKKTTIIFKCISLSVFCYIVHNLISFGQVLNTPFIFILMAVALSDLDFEEGLYFDKSGV